MRNSKKRRPATSVESVRHQDKRVNIPTTELSAFVADDERAPRTVLYPRDPSLDPQLVWRGKDEQDGEPLEVPAVPVYIQEKIHPQALIENLRETARAGEQEPELRLFDDFNGIYDFERKVEFYQHPMNWSNRMILGDSLLVMTSLAEKEGLKGKVQMIYLDPPYGIQFGSNWQVSTRRRTMVDGRIEDATREPEQIRAFRDTWKLGIHSYLAYWRDRLMVARDLLTETGSIFVQIGDENLHLVRSLMDEVFGSENFIAFIPFRKKTMPLGARYLEGISDYLLWYAKARDLAKYRQLYIQKTAEGDTHWDRVELPDGTRRKMTREEIADHGLLPVGAQPYQLIALYPVGINASGLFEVKFDGVPYAPPRGKSWLTSPEGMRRLIRANRIEPYAGGATIRYVLKLGDYPHSPLTNLWADTSAPTDMTYVVETNRRVIERCLLMTTDPGDLVLDPTCGSGTTAYVAEEWGRRWITVDTSRVALTLARTRLMSGRYRYYLLADSPEGAGKESEITGQPPPSQSASTKGDIRRGFVLRRAPGSHANTSRTTRRSTQLMPVGRNGWSRCARSSTGR